MIEIQGDAVEPIAIIGMACRVAGAENVEQFWSNLVNGVESIRFGTREEYAALGVPKADVDDPDFVPACALFAEPEYFDATMFDMSAAEAEMRDPHHKLFLELSYTAIADSGYDPRRYPGEIGVYGGSGEDGYQWKNVRRNRAASTRAGAVGLAVNSHPDYIATLTSYKLGLRGPSLTVHTACSTSLVAVHLACEALRNGECDMALAGAANVELPLGHGYLYQEGGVYSRDGHCRAFDAAATGTVWSSGGGVVVLKCLHDALSDGDDIRAVIIGNAINNDGDTKVGFTAPSEQGQAAVIARALELGAVDPRTIEFVEAHGTGTVLGDPIEVAALTSVYRRHSDDLSWCAIGSVKTNIGHLGPAAGVAGLIKATLALTHHIIPPNLHFETGNPQIDFPASPFYVNSAPIVWKDGEQKDGERLPRRAAVSSFGIGGTNSHLVLQQAPAASRKPDRRDSYLIQLSAKTPTALAASASALARHLDAANGNPAANGSPVELSDIEYTLRVGRQELPERLAVVARDSADAASALASKRRWITGSAAGQPPHVVFMFPGQGAQYAGMGAEIYSAEPVYRDAVDECCEALSEASGGTNVKAIRELLTSGGDDAQSRQTTLAQPALFIVEYALAALWQSWGIAPDSMIGHSIGEYVAATYAGVFYLADALGVVARRGELMQSLPFGAMIAVQLDESEIAGYLPDGASVAAINGPDACVISGPVPAIDALVADLAKEEIGVRRLRTSHAFHSAMMNPILSAFRDVVSGVELRVPQMPCTSGVTGDWLTADDATDPAYWARQLREAVRFGDCVTTAAGQDTRLFLECGPGRQLSGLVRMLRSGHTVVTSLPGREDRDQTRQLLTAAVGRLWVAGCSPRPTSPPGSRVSLPTYPWERKRHWVNPDQGTEAAQPASRPSSRPGTDEDYPAPEPVSSWYAVPAWRQLPPRTSRPAAASRTLLLGDQDGLADELAARGSEVIRVQAGGCFAISGPSRYQVRPASREDYDALLADLGSGEGIPAHLVHSWTMSAAPAADSEQAWLAQDRGFFSLLALVQALAGAVAEDPDASIRLDVVTSGACQVLGTDLVRPEHSTVAGAVKVLPLECPWLTARQIDIDQDFGRGLGHQAGSGKLLRSLIDELCDTQQPQASQPREPLVALRRGRRWHRRFEPVPTPEEDDEPVLREGGTYLITGGLGGIGISIAEDLAVRYRARLVLASRTGLPPRDHWDDPANGSADGAATSDQARRAILAIRRMEQAGGEVQVIAADVTDPVAVRRLRDDVVDRYGSIDGIIHAAGLAGGGMAEIKNRADAERVFRPKVQGTLALRDAFAGTDLDFVVLCSSVTAVAGGFGQVDYCAANAFLDAHAASDHGWNARVVSVNWGTWLAVGMAAETDRPAAWRALQAGQAGQAGQPSTPIRHGILTQRHLAAPGQPSWCSGLVSPATHWLLADHRIAGVPVMPGTAHLEAARCAFAECYPPESAGQSVELRDVIFPEPLAVPDGQVAELRVVLRPGPGEVEFEVQSLSGDATHLHAQGVAAWTDTPLAEGAEGAKGSDLPAIRERCAGDTAGSGAAGDTGLLKSRSGLVTFGPRWSSLDRIYQGREESLALLTVKGDGLNDADPWILQPALLDEAITASSRWPGQESSFLPLGYGRIVIRRALPRTLWAHLAYRDSGTQDLVTADATLYDEAGGEVARIEEFAMRKVDVTAMTSRLTAVTPGQDGSRSAIGPAAGAEAFRLLVGSGLRDEQQVVISATPVTELLAASGKLTYEAVERGLEQPEAARPAPASGMVSLPGTERQRVITEILRDLLGDPTAGPDEDFFELGGNSLVAVQLLAILRKELGVRIPMRRFFADPTAIGIAALIDDLAPAASADAGEQE